MWRVLIAGLLSAGLVLEQPALPDRDQFLSRARAALRLDPELQQRFTYLEQRRDVKISRLGKVTVGPLSTYEVYPSPEPGGTYKRLIAVDGKPLSPAELAEADAEHRRDLEKQAERMQKPWERREIEKEAADARARREALLADALAVYEGKVAGSEVIDGAAAVVLALTPRQDAAVTTREGSWMKHFTGRVWFAEADAQFIRLDMRAESDVSIGWGIIGRVHEGTRIYVTRRRVEDTWLPAEQIYQATGRTLLFRPFAVDVTTRFSNYKRREQAH